MYNDYFEICNQYSVKYNNVIVLYQVGSFYTIYGRHENKDFMIKASNILDIALTKTKNSIAISISNPFMMGFPVVSFEKFISKLINNDYTVVVVDQIVDVNNKIERKVARVLSKGSIISNDTENTIKLTSIYIHKSCIYMTTIDIITNHSVIFEYKDEDVIDNIEKVLKVLSIEKPKELVISFDNDTNKYSDFIAKLSSITYVHMHPVIDKKYKNSSYQELVLNKVFQNDTMLTITDYLELVNRQSSLISFVMLLDFCHQHDEKLLHGLQKHTFNEPDNKMLLYNNVLQHLNIVSINGTEKISSINSFLNNTISTMGKRYFKNRLINPITDIDELNYCYDMNEAFINDDLYVDVRKDLSNIHDIDTIFKLFNIGRRIKTINIYNLYITLQTIITIDKQIKNVVELLTDIEVQDILKMLESIETTFCINSLVNDDDDFINENFDESIKNSYDQIKNIKKFYDDFVDVLNENKKEFERDDENFTVKITNIRYKNLLKDKVKIEEIKKKFEKIGISEGIEKFCQQQQKTKVMLSTHIMTEKNVKLKDIEANLTKMIEKCYIDWIQKFVKDFANIFKSLTNFCKIVDYHSCIAYNSIKYSYNRPTIDETSIDSYIDVKNVRHVLVERINDDIMYVTNDVKLCKEGMLIYGYNGVGKSVLLKSIGISILMAQAGMYTPTSSMIYKPYKKLFVRLSTSDDIFMGRSTFMSEMHEVKNILNNADNSSMILTDEILQSTESISGLALISSVIVHLSEVKCCFMIASHMHDITTIDDIKKLKNLKVYNMDVKYDKIRNIVIYNRKLVEGQGISTYGLEVAKSLNLPNTFNNRSDRIRRELMKVNDNIVEYKPSRYNSKVLVDKCEVCGDSTDEIHHIKEQHKADKNGMIDNHHKNVKNNLMNVCNVCHDKIHRKEIVVEGYKQTSKGKILVYDIKTDVKIDRKNYGM